MDIVRGKALNSVSNLSLSLIAVFGLSLSDLIEEAFEHLARRWPRPPLQPIERLIAAGWPLKIARLTDLDLQHFGKCDQPGPVVGRKILVDQVKNAFAIRVVMAGKVRQKFAG